MAIYYIYKTARFQVCLSDVGDCKSGYEATVLFFHHLVQTASSQEG